MLEADFVLTLWLGEYPDHSVTFLNLVLILCLIQTLKSPRTTIYHATGHIKLTNIVVGSILCAAFPLAYLFLKLGMSPESVFWAANISMALSEVASVFVLKRYMDYSVAKYLLQVHGRCILVVVVSGILPYFLFDKLMEPSFLRLIMTCVLTTTCIGITVLTVGMDKDMRIKLLHVVCKNRMRNEISNNKTV